MKSIRFDSRSLFLIPFLLAGCATSQMKSTPFYEGGNATGTGNVEDRVNLWPPCENIVP